MGSLEVTLVPVLGDNYAYILHEELGNKTAVVDPGEARPITSALHQKGYKLNYIFLTHHHHDHIGGAEALSEKSGAVIVGPSSELERIPHIDLPVDEQEGFQFGELEVKVIETPGHTLGHIAFWIPEANALFCGDTLFAMGCGRLFEGTAEQMWTSLQKLRALPPETKVYCGHEYSVDSARFAHSLTPTDQRTTGQLHKFQGKRQRNQPTIPTTLAEELQTNPFLRVEDPAYCTEIGAPSTDPQTAFAYVRTLKDEYRG